MIAQTPHPPYFAVIFTSLLTDNDDGYEGMAMLMEELAKDQPGYLGIESARSGIGITVSYWATVDAIKEWKNNLQHQVAQKLGKEQWYSAYKTRICLVERDYEL